jgi:hypothetical protein
MDKAAPQAATGASDKDASALEVLRVLWGPEYSVGYDDEHGWWATRAGVIGHIITAADPEELGRKLGDDCGAAR